MNNRTRLIAELEEAADVIAEQGYGDVAVTIREAIEALKDDG